MFKNICNFIPYNSDAYSIHTINFVLETKEYPVYPLKAHSMYRAHYVRGGSGKLHISHQEIPLKQGDVFFTFPDMQFSIESFEDFSYMYISFLGSRSNMIMDKLKISQRNFLFSGCEELSFFWESGLPFNVEISDLLTESVLLYTFAYLGNRILPKESENRKKDTLSLRIKNYIDDNFSNPELSLEQISKEVSYSPKYISTVFKKSFAVGITEYINTVRIQNACTLINQGATSVNEISIQCGYADAQYFSKIFKKKIGLSPKAFINSYK